MIQEIAPHWLANEFLPDVMPEAGQRVLYVRGQELAVRRVDVPGEPPAFELPRVGELGVAEEGLTFLFSIDGEPLWLAPDAGAA